MRLSSLVYTFFCKKAKISFAALPTTRATPRRGRTFAARQIRVCASLALNSTPHSAKKLRADERNVLSVRLAPQRPCGKNRAPLSGRARSKPALFSVVYRNMATIKKMINASIITAKITPHTTDRRNIVLFSPSEPG